MPCWFYEKPDLINTPSFKDSIDASTEARYRREAARFIIDAGTSQGLRYDTMATGVIFMHRFYMFHSFKEFPRYVTGAACLFLAGKVEETPKKCKDIIRIAKALVPDPHFASFGDDPKEEIMTHERILLQTIKFDLQVLHPYSYLLKYAKTIKGDKNKIQKLVQMAWTFVNDSLCTTLCLQWEPHIVATAFLYLAGRLSKSDLLDWSGKNSKLKWWDQLTDDVSLEIMEDVCHQLLDLYSSGQSKGGPLPGTPPKLSGKKKGTKTPRAPAESGKTAATEEPRAKVAKIEKTREPQPKTALPVPASAPASQGAPPEVIYVEQPKVPPPPPKQALPVEVPLTHPAPPATSYPVQPSRPAPPTALPPQQAAPIAAPQASQYYQGTYAPATATSAAPAAYATSAPPATYTTVPSQPYPAQPAAPAAPPPPPQAQPAYPAGQYPTAPAYGTQYYGQQQQPPPQQSAYGQQYAQQQAPPTYPATAAPAQPPPPAVTTQAPVQYASHPQYTAQYGQTVPAAPQQHAPQQPYNPNIPPPGHPQPGHPQPGHPQPGHPQPGHPQPGHQQPGHPQPGHPQPGHPQPRHPQPPPSNVLQPHTMPPSHSQPPPPSHPPPSHPPPAHAPPNYPPPAPHSHPHPPPPQNYAPQPPNPGTPTGPPPQPYRYNAPQFQMAQNLAMPRGPPPPHQHRGPPPQPNVSTGLATVRISSREAAWPVQQGNSTQEGDDWD